MCQVTPVNIDKTKGWLAQGNIYIYYLQVYQNLLKTGRIRPENHIALRTKNISYIVNFTSLMLYPHPDYKDTCLFREMTQYVSLELESKTAYEINLRPRN